MSTVIDVPHRDNGDRYQRWDRFERAALFEQYLALHAQGISQRQAAQRLQVPRSPLQAWHSWPDTLDLCPHVAQCFHSGPGLAFLHRLVLARHRVCVEGGACGIRGGCLLLNLTGFDRFVAASYGAQHQGHRPVEHALVDYRQAETARLAKDMPRPAITVPQDETFTGGRCLVAPEPVRTCIILAHLAQARDQDAWHALMAPARAPLHWEVLQSTSDAAPGLVAYVAHPLGAPHSADFFHVQQARSTAGCAPLATKERAADQALTAARAQREQGQAGPESPGDQPEQRAPGRPPKAPLSREHARQALAVARRAHAGLPPQRARVTPRLEAIGQAYHFVDRARGVRRNGPLLASDIRTQIETMRTVAQHEHLSQSSRDRIANAARVGPKMQATMAFVAGSGRQPGRQLDWTPPASFAMPARLIPACDLERVAPRRTVSQGKPLRELALRLRTPLFAPGGALSQWRPAPQSHLQPQAQELAEIFQRASSHVAGRHGSLSLRTHQLRGLDRPRKRTGLTTIHNFFRTRSDGTTAAARLFGQKPRAIFAAILDAVDLPPAPRSPQRRF